MHDTEEREKRYGDPTARSISLWWLLWLVFLPFGLPVAATLTQAHLAAPRLVASLSGAALFLALYLWTAWQNARDLASSSPSRVPDERALWLPIVLMALLAWALTALNGPVWGALFIYTAAIAAGRLPLRQALGAIGAIALLTVIGGWHLHLPPVEIAQDLLTLGITSAATLTVVHSVRTNRTLQAEREEATRYAAVTAERLRIARDLHDLLGHSLSLIVLKSELAGRLMQLAPERAVAEIADIESVARTALQEVREAVAGYRQPTLAEELHAARDLLAAAGIAYSCESGDVGTNSLPSAGEAVLAWAVREGVTNVIRHSRARTCRIYVLCTRDAAQVEICDDGEGSPSVLPAPPSVRTGSGLRGLAERVEGLGGRCEAGRSPGGGYRLAVWLPSGAPDGDVGASGGSSAPDMRTMDSVPMSSLPPASVRDSREEGGPS